MESRLKILIVNDDGINAEGLQRLAAAAAAIGRVWIVAPSAQCSAMSHRLTIRQRMKLDKVDYPVNVEAAYSLGGMPADCVKVGLYHVMPEFPDMILSGINHGMNMGFDTFYSGTVCAAIEGRMNRVPSIAVSNEDGLCWDTAEKYLPEILKKLINSPLAGNEVWNVNFPACLAEECRGIRWGTRVAPMQIFSDQLTVETDADGAEYIIEDGPKRSGDLAPEDTDFYAVKHKYISVSKIRMNRLLTEQLAK